MKVITIANTNQLAKGQYLGVQAHEEADAVAQLLAIAIRRGIELSDIVYRWGGTYFYAPVMAERTE